jgi:3-oxoacyl-[acyl-carrier protein] reductase
VDEGRLRARVALISGAGGGIGAAVARRLAAEGAQVVVNDLTGEACAGTVAALEAAGGHAVAAPGDVRDPLDAAAIVAVAHDWFGGLDILVNNAGVTRDALIHRMSDDDWVLVHDVALRGAFNLCRAAAPSLRGARDAPPAHHRKVVNISSTVGIHGVAGAANYVAAKAGLIGLTRALSREWARSRVNVNAVAPGLIAGTGLTEAKPAELIADVVARVPIGRAGTAEDVAAAVAFLASPEADYVTGEVLQLHGGLDVT